MNKTLLSIVLIVVVLTLGVVFSKNKNIDNPLTTTTETTRTPEASMVELKNGDTFDLTASYVTKVVRGREQKMLAYNGTIPGPTIKVAQGAQVTINFKNNTDMPQLLHSHGVRMDAEFDGSQMVQEEMKPGESFAYTLKFPDAGVYWYHPHVQEVYGQGLGLYGAFVVTPEKEDYFPKVNREIPLFISDLAFENGKTTLKKGDETYTLMGHYGDIQLLNGEENYNLKAVPGEVVRFYVINAALARPFKFGIKDVKMKLVGGDNGAYENPTFVENVILGPSERAIVDVYFRDEGVYEVENQTPDTTYSLGTITVAGPRATSDYQAEFAELVPNAYTTESIDAFRGYFEKSPDKQLTLGIDMGGNMMSMSGMGHGAHMMPDGTMMGGSMMSVSPDGIEWDDTNEMMNAMTNNDSITWKIIDDATKKVNDEIHWMFEKDTPVKIRIFNDDTSMHPMQHPIHFHGQRFLVVARDGVKETNLVWKDTTLVRAGETVDILLVPSNPGMWMAHCHISEHLSNGMMFDFEVH